MPSPPAISSSTQEPPPSRLLRRWRRLAVVGWCFSFLTIIGLCLVLLLPTLVAQAANKIIHHMFPGGVIECSITQIGFFQANLAIDAREVATTPDRPGQRIIKLPHCRITYRPLAIMRGRIDAIEIIGATMTARYENGEFTLPLLKLLTQKTPKVQPSEPASSATATKFNIESLPDIGHVSLQSCTLMLRWENRFYHTPVTLDLRQGDQGWANPQAHASLRFNGQLLMLRDCNYQADTGSLSGSLRISEVRLDSLPPPANTWAETHELRGKLDLNGAFEVNLAPFSLNTLTSNLRLTDLNARLGQEVISAAKLETTLNWQEQQGDFSLGGLHTTSLGLLKQLRWQFKVENHHASNGQLSLQFENQPDRPMIINTNFQRQPVEQTITFTMQANDKENPLQMDTVWGKAVCGQLQTAINHTTEETLFDLQIKHAQLETAQANLQQADLNLNGSFQTGKIKLNANAAVARADCKIENTQVKRLTAKLDLTHQEGQTNAELKADCAAIELPEKQLQAQNLRLEAKANGNLEHLSAEVQLQAKSLQHDAQQLKISQLHLQGAASGSLEHLSGDLQLQAASLHSASHQAKANNLRLHLQAEGSTQQFAGALQADVADARLEKQDLTWNNIFWQQQFASHDTRPGMLTVTSMCHGDDNLLAATIQTMLTPSQDLSSADLDLEANILLQDFPTAQWQITSQNKVGKNILVSQNTFSLPPTELSHLELERFLPAGVSLELAGTLSMSGSFALGGGRPAQGQAKVNLQQVDLALPQQQVRAEKLNLQFELPVLPELRTRAGQPIECQKLQISNLVFTDLQTRLRLESTDSLTLERAQAHWAGGTIHLGATDFNPRQPDLDLLLFCDRINLAEVFHQLGNDQMSGHGALSGTLPIMINNGRVNFGDGFLATVPGVKGDIKLAAAQNLAAGLAPGTAAYNQLKFSGDALRHFLYDWLKISLNSQDDDLLFRLQVSGKPADPLPYSYVKGEFVAIDGQTDFSQIQLDVNLRFPLNQLLSTFDELQHLMQGFKP